MSKRNLPPIPKLSSIIGPSFVLLGLALGSGELILWPFLAANYGLGLMWGALVGITIQFFLNTEIMRYSLVWGESIFVGFKRLWSGWPIWFILSTFIPWGLPGFSSASAQILANIFPDVFNQKLLAIGILLFTGLVLTLGETLYKTMEFLQRTIIIVGLPLIVLLVVLVTNQSDWLDLAQGLVGKGQGFWFLPAGLTLSSFLGALAYSGAGGNLNLTQSFNVKEKGFGMGKYAFKIVSVLRKKVKTVKLEGETFDVNKNNLKKFRDWWQLVNKEHLIVFWGLGFVSIVLLSVLAKSLVFGQASSQGITFIYQEANVIGQMIGPVFRLLFLVIAALMLYATQLGVLESSSRIISENILLLAWQEKKEVNASLWFYLALWGQIFLGIVILLLGVSEPKFLLTLSAVLNALSMKVLFHLVWYLNKRRLDKKLQPSLARQVITFASFLFFAVFSIITLTSFV